MNTMHARTLWLGTMLAAGMLLAGCDDGQPSRETSAAHSQAAAHTPSAEQIEIEKYNAYVDAANRGGNFAEIREKRRADYAKVLASKDKLSDYGLFSAYDISGLRDNLKKALALSSPMPELDEPANAMLTALETLEPLHRDLSNYADSKGYLADGGQKARELEPALDAALERVATAQATFYEGLAKRDEINVQHAFDEAERDSQDYYRAGFVLYAKQAVRLSMDFFESAGSQASIVPFEERLGKVAQMIEGWNKQNTDQSPSCTVLLSRMNQFIAKGREAIETARTGGYVYDEQRQLSWKINNPIERDAKNFNRAYDNVIDALNSTRCQ
jgi:hypothetical protein